MMNEFKQTTIDLSVGSAGMIKVSKLESLIQAHPFYSEVVERLKIGNIREDEIVIQNIDTAFKAVRAANEKYEKINVLADTKDIAIHSVTKDDKMSVVFTFEECRVDDELIEGLEAEAIYDSKNSFFEEYKMSKYANHLYDAGFSALVNVNIEYFKNLAQTDKKQNKSKSYRLLKSDEKYFLRGITSDKYNEYGIDFTFFSVMILLHYKMSQSKGNNYSIVSLSVSESKLDMIVKDNRVVTIDNFGKVSIAIKISTNELGTGSLNVTSTIRVENRNNDTLVYLFPKESPTLQTKHVINHTTTLPKVFEKLRELETLLNISDEFVKDVTDIKGIKAPDELRHKIQMKIEHPNSVFKNVNDLKDIFKNKIDNEISNFSVLLQMCQKAELLEMDYDTKDKLRYIISDIILYGRA